MDCDMLLKFEIHLVNRAQELIRIIKRIFKQNSTIVVLIYIVIQEVKRIYKHLSLINYWKNDN